MSLDDLLDAMGESYYPYHEYGDNEVYVTSNKEQKTATKNAILTDLLEIIDSCFESNDGFIDDKLRNEVRKYCE